MINVLDASDFIDTHFERRELYDENVVELSRDNFQRLLDSHNELVDEVNSLRALVTHLDQ